MEKVRRCQELIIFRRTDGGRAGVEDGDGVIWDGRRGDDWRRFA